MKIQQFRYFADNFGYLVYEGDVGVAIDGGAVDSMRSFMERNGIELKYVVNTHSHFDHTAGNQGLLEKSDAEFIATHKLKGENPIRLAKEELKVYHTPGHTSDSVVFYTGDTLICGDTLFNGTVGNCFSGEFFAFFNSLKRLLEFPENTVIYAGHDYVDESMEFARRLEPDNEQIDIYLKKYDPEHVCSTLAEEIRVNPYLKFNDEKMTQILKRRGFSVQSEYDRWYSIMSIE